MQENRGVSEIGNAPPFIDDDKCTQSNNDIECNSDTERDDEPEAPIRTSTSLFRDIQEIFNQCREEAEFYNDNADRDDLNACNNQFCPALAQNFKIFVKL